MVLLVCAGVIGIAWSHEIKSKSSMSLTTVVQQRNFIFAQYLRLRTTTNQDSE